MNVIKCGTEVITKLESIHCLITCISIRFDKITYEVSYFRNGIYYTVWLNEEEFSKVDEVNKSKIGFKTND